MTQRELERAKELDQEIKNLGQVVYVLERTIEREKIKEWEITKRQGGTFNRKLRFLNYKRRADEQEKAGIILFYGVSVHGEDIPVDLEVIQNMLSFFQNRLEQREEEFRILGSGGNDNA